jgi:putative hydrolase of the HAD superfamily
MINKIQIIGFDLDNTLYDQAQHTLAFFHHASLKLAQKSKIDATKVENTFINVWKYRTSFYSRLFDEVLEELGIFSNDAINELVLLYHEYKTTLSLYEGVKELLKKLKQQYHLFMITDGNEKMQLNKIKSLAIADYFDEIVITGIWGKDWYKPSLLPFQHIYKQMCGTPENYLYIGDNPLCDFYGAKKLGMKTVRVKTEPFANIVVNTEYDADLTLNKTIELEEILK